MTIQSHRSVPFTIRSLISIIVVCALMLPSMTGMSQAQGTSYVFIEDFASAADYTQTSSGVRISDGQVHWNVSRNFAHQCRLWGCERACCIAYAIGADSLLTIPARHRS